VFIAFWSRTTSRTCHPSSIKDEEDEEDEDDYEALRTRSLNSSYSLDSSSPFSA